MRRRATGERRLFVDGVLDGVSFGGTNVLTANAAINIGGNTLDGRYFLGLMDDRDSQVNLLEFAFDTNPLSPNLSAFTIARDKSRIPMRCCPGSNLFPSCFDFEGGICSFPSACDKIASE